MKEKIILGGGRLHEKIATLKVLKTDGTNCLIYYIDENNSEKWVEEKPYPEMHGGWPSQLRSLEKFPWE